MQLTVRDCNLRIVGKGGRVRDIRQDLRERLDAVAAEQDRLQKQVGDLEGQKKLLETLLQEEERRWPDSNPGVAVNGKNGHNTRDLSELILEIMSDGEDWYGSTVAAVAEKRGYHFGDAKPGRSTHFTLLGLAKNNRVESVGLGKWKLKGTRKVKDEADAA